MHSSSFSRSFFTLLICSRARLSLASSFAGEGSVPDDDTPFSVSLSVRDITDRITAIRAYGRDMTRSLSCRLAPSSQMQPPKQTKCRSQRGLFRLVRPHFLPAIRLGSRLQSLILHLVKMALPSFKTINVLDVTWLKRSFFLFSSGLWRMFLSNEGE